MNFAWGQKAGPLTRIRQRLKYNATALVCSLGPADCAAMLADLDEHERALAIESGRICLCGGPLPQRSPVRLHSAGGTVMGDDNDWRGQAEWRTSKRTKQKATDKFNAALRVWIVAIGSRVVDVDPETEALLKALDAVIASREPT